MAIFQRNESPAEEPLKSIWDATWRVSTPNGAGSAYCVSQEPLLLATCAHCVNGYWTVDVQHLSVFFNQYSMKAQVRSINYPRDLAVLEVDRSTIPDPDDWDAINFSMLDTEYSYLPPMARKIVNALEEAIIQDDGVYPWDLVFEQCGPVDPEDLAKLRTVPMRFAESLSPGETVYFCGYPLFSRTPLIASGMASGFQPVQMPDGTIDGIALNAAINPGNSGGPVCDVNGHVVGTIFAAKVTLAPQYLEGFDEDQQRTLAQFKSTTGIAYALDAADTQQMLSFFLECRGRIFREFDKVPPKPKSLLRSDFIAFQQECVEKGVNPNGPFSFKDPTELFAGFTNAANRQPLNPDHLQDLLPEISWSGGSFFIMGNKVMLWRQKYRGYTNPCTIELR